MLKKLIFSMVAAGLVLTGFAAPANASETVRDTVSDETVVISEEILDLPAVSAESQQLSNLANPEALRMQGATSGADSAPIVAAFNRSYVCTAMLGTTQTCRGTSGVIGTTSRVWIGYSWGVRFFSDGEAYVRARGYNSTGREGFYNAGVGKSGSRMVPWGNVASVKAVKVSPTLPPLGVTIRWQ